MGTGNNNLLFIFEVLSFKMARYLRRKYGKKVVCDEKDLALFYGVLRHVLHFYKDIDEDSVVVGIEFCLTKKDDTGQHLYVGAFIALNNKKRIEIKNSNLVNSVTQMFGSKIIKDGKVFFHWSEIEEFEQKSKIVKITK